MRSAPSHAVTAPGLTHTPRAVGSQVSLILPNDDDLLKRLEITSGMVWSVAPAAVAAPDPGSLHLHLPAMQLLGSDVWVPIQVGVDKPLGFSETGIVASQSDVLANAGVTVFYWSTFTTVLLVSCVAYLTNL